MWVKIIGSVIIITAGTALGFNIAARYSERPRQIRQLISCLASLKAYISYAAIPLPEALVDCTGGTEGAITSLFHATADNLLQRGWLTPREAMAEAIGQISDLALAESELELLGMLGANLGSMNCTEQEKYLIMIQEQLQQLEYEAVRLSAQNTKMYRYLGICGSLAIVILLV